MDGGATDLVALLRNSIDEVLVRRMLEVVVDGRHSLAEVAHVHLRLGHFARHHDASTEATGVHNIKNRGLLLFASATLHDVFSCLRQILLAKTLGHDDVGIFVGGAARLFSWARARSRVLHEGVAQSGGRGLDAADLLLELLSGLERKRSRLGGPAGALLTVLFTGRLEAVTKRIVGLGFTTIN